MKRVLLITSCFPPANATGIHRTLALVRHLAARGYQTLVLTMPPASDMDVDQSLLQRVPQSVQVLRVPFLDLTQTVKRWFGREPASSNGSAADAKPVARSENKADEDLPPRSVADWCTKWLQFPDSRVGWALSALLQGIGRVRQYHPDVIYSSAPMWSCQMLAMVVQRLIRRPWVADCRDPWRANPFRRFQYRAHDWADSFLESQMVRHATAVVCNTAGVRRDFAERYPDSAGKFVAIPNGFDATEVAAVMSQGRQTNGHLRLVHAGVFYGSRSPRPLLEAMASLAAEDPNAREQVRLVQVGVTDYEGTPLRELAARCGVQDMLELTGPLRHRPALQQVYAGDVALAVSQVGSNGDLQVPRKFYEYYGLGRCVLVSGGCCGAIRELFDGQLPQGLWLVDDPSTSTLTVTLQQMLQRWRSGRLEGCSSATVDLSEARMTRDIERQLLLACGESAAG